MKEKFIEWLFTPKTEDGFSPLQAIVFLIGVSPVLYLWYFVLTT